MFRILLLALLAFVAAAAPPAIDAGKAGMDPERLARIAARMKALVDKGAIAGTVTLVQRHGAPAHLEAVGYADIQSHKPMRPDSIFQIMSMTKPFTGVAVMMLAEEGKLGLNDPVEKHLPEFRGLMVIESRGPDGSRTLRKPGRAITIRDLMTHTSGMASMPPEGIKDLYQRLNLPLAEAVTIYSQQPLEFEPGSRWMYSNTGIATLGRLVEVAGDQAFERFLEERIFKPLGMADTFIFPPADKIERIVTHHRTVDGKLQPAGGEALGGDSRRYRKGARYSFPEAGIYSTARDLAAFYQMMLNHGAAGGRRLLSRAAVDLMTALHTGDLQAGHNPGTGFGLTWEVSKLPGLNLWSAGTFGHGGAFGTHGWVDRQKDLVGVFMVQGGAGASEAKQAFIAMASASIAE
jgi:CubicO group peptidase (beta-lactamase class C family)